MRPILCGVCCSLFAQSSQTEPRPMPSRALAFTLICVVLALLTVELISWTRWGKRVSFRCKLDMQLTEPGERMTLSYRICNTGFWPLPSVSLSFFFDGSVEILDELNLETLGKSRQKYFTLNTSLMPHQVLRGTVRLCLQERGPSSLGRVYLETGSFLGLRQIVQRFDLPVHVVCTARRAEETPKLEPLGGFLGDVSVRRFILEDPSLILGYRDYTGSEPMKSISWTQTARVDRLMVKNHDYTVDTDVAVLVDVEACRKATAERCLSLTRTVCDELERLRIPYVLLSNGDLYSTRKGVGRTHNFEIQRRIGVSRFIRYLGFSHLLRDCLSDSYRRGYIVVAPRLTEEIALGVRRLQAASGARVCVLTGEEAEPNA